MSKRLALRLFVLAMVLIAAAYASAFLPGEPPGWAAWSLAGGTCLSLVAMMALGAARQGRIGRRLAAAFGAVLIVVGGGFAILLALPPTDPGDPTLWLGLPPRAAVLLYGIGIVPFFIVPVAYAWTFDAFTLSSADLARVREAGRRGSAGSDESAEGSQHLAPAGGAGAAAGAGKGGAA